MENKNITFMKSPVTLIGTEAKVGTEAPNFSALKSDLTSIDLYSFKDKIKVITVFPSIDTKVCAMQVRKFNAELGSISRDVVVLAISNDLPFAQSRFCAAEGLSHVVTLSDHRNTEFGLKYGFLIKELRLLSRGVVIVDKDNTIKYVEYVKEVSNEPNYEKAIEAVKNMID